MNDLQVLASNIRAERARLGLNQTQLGDICGVSLATISRIEAGTHRPQTRTITKLAEAFGLDAAALWQTH